jgi:hypothetical protein
MSRPPSKEQMQQFCSTCDLLGGDGTCALDKDRLENRIQITVKKKIEDGIQEVKVPLCEIVACHSDACVKYCSSQQRYVARDSCTWTSVNGQNGRMTKYGFTPGSVLKKV